MNRLVAYLLAGAVVLCCTTTAFGSARPKTSHAAPKLSVGHGKSPVEGGFLL